jgi:DNA-binding winged helix-turn-helix (wHTH) protein
MDRITTVTLQSDTRIRIFSAALKCIDILYDPTRQEPVLRNALMQKHVQIPARKEHRCNNLNNEKEN